MNQSVKPEDIIIEGETAIWNINFTAPIGGTYQGTFKFRCYLTPIQIIDADREFRSLIGDYATKIVDQQAENYSYSLSQLKQRVIQAPPFWDDGQSRIPGGNIKDREVILHIFEAAIQAELKFRAMIEERHKKALEQLQSYVEKQKQLQKMADEIAESDQNDNETQ